MQLRIKITNIMITEENYKEALAIVTQYRKQLGFSGSCECGEHKECVRKIHSNSEGKLWVEIEEHFKCGKVKKQLKSMLDWWNNYR
jgi:predicted SprT family Zn-dependent metalloprotease